MDLNRRDSIKKFRDILISKNALNEQNKIKAAQSVENIRNFYNKIGDKEIELLRSRGIEIQHLMSYDLERVCVDREYHKKFIEDFEQVIDQLESLLIKESQTI